MNPYIAQADVVMRLDSTYCMFDGAPCYVRVNKNFKCGEIMVAPIPYKLLDQELLISIEDERFSFIPPELGYINQGGISCVFLSRLPDRVQKQGLSMSSVRIEGPGQNETMKLGPSTLLNSEGFVSACANKYPSYTDALRSMSTGAYGVAFSKTLAIARVDKNLIGLYKGMSLIGIFDKKQSLTLLDNGNHKIIRRMLTRHGVLM